MKDATFNQKVAALITLTALVLVGLVLFIPSQVDEKTKAIALLSITGALSAGIILFLKASSDAKNAAQMKDITEQLGNSVPNNIHAAAITSLANSTPLITPEPEKVIKE